MNTNVNYVEFLEMLVEKNIFAYGENHAKCGRNGPYGHADTPTRNTAHWLIVLSYLWENTKDSRYFNKAIEYADYLYGIQKSSVSGAVKCMENTKFDHMNGLMGQAWYIEAMIEASMMAGDKKYYQSARDVFFVPVYNWSDHMWERIELDGSNIGYDKTFNHQLWFAAAGSLLLEYEEDSEIERIVGDYLSGCCVHFQTHPDGLIKHYGDLPDPYEHHGFTAKIKSILKKTILKPMRRIDPNKFDIDSYERAYHLFNLYGFAILYKRFAEHPFFKSESFKKSVKYGLNIEVLNDFFNINRFVSDGIRCKMNKFAYAYNSPAFEYPYISEVFAGNTDMTGVNRLFLLQVKSTFDESTSSFSRNNNDGVTLTARIYELVRFLRMKSEEEIK